MAVVAVKYFLFLVALYLCTDESCAPGPRKFFFELTKKSIIKQKVYHNRWNQLINAKEIKKTTRELNSGLTRPLYKFEGDKVNNMKLGEVFTMLQNFALRADNHQHHFFDLNIGGEKIEFRLSKDFFGNGQILVYDKDGYKIPYSDISNALDKETTKTKERAEQMLTSTNEPLNDQTPWTETDSNVKEKMKLLMIVSQVAEAATPSDESFDKVKEIMSEVTNFELKTVAEEWQNGLNKVLQEERNSLSEERYNELRMKLLKEVPTETALKDASFLDFLPQELSELKARLLVEAKNVVKRANEKAVADYREKIEGYKPKRGRVPGSDVVMRNLLEKLAKGEIRTFEELFSAFVLPETGGTQMGRKMWYPLLEGGSTFEHLSTERQTVDQVAVATHDGVESAIKEAIKRNSCDSRRRRKRRSSCSLQRLKVIEDSIQLEGNRLTFDTFDENGRRRSHEVNVDADRLPLSEYTSEHLANLEESGHLRGTEVVGKAIAKYGAAVNTLASIAYLSRGEFGRGAFSAFQAAHGIGGLTGFNDVISRVTKRTLGKLTTATAEKFISRRFLQRISEVGTKVVGETTSKVLGRFAAGLPVVGLTLDIYFITEDIKELQDKDSSLPVFLKVSHLVLDLETTILSLVDTAVPELTPVVEPIVIALTILRLGIDDFYLDINEELTKVRGKDFGTKVVAFLKGAAEGVFDLATLGLGRQLRQLEQQQAHDRTLLRNLSDPVSYFNVTFQGMDADGNEVGTVDFTAGILSQFGGFLTVRLNENGSFTVHLPEVPTKSGYTREVTKTFSFNHSVTDIVLGIGQVANPIYRREEAKLWLLFNVRDFNIIDRFETHSSSQYGTYFGNSKDNNFYALQGRKKKRSIDDKVRARQPRQTESDDCPKTDGFTVQLQSYHYDLHGREGNDRFFLGPQSSRVTGGDDNDMYYIPSSGGRAIINNFAHDEEMDTLFLNVSYSSIFCRREKWDLIIGYCQTHTIRIRNWFSHGLEEFHRHIYITTVDGVVVEAIKTDLDAASYRTNCVAVTVDKSQSSSGEVVMLTGSFSEVKQVVGSSYADRIIGNEKPNILNGGSGGTDYLEGGNGTDTYIVGDGSGMAQINNTAEDNEEDLLLIGIPYTDIGIEKNSLHLLLYNSSDRTDTEVQLLHWFRGTKWQHMMFTSRDYIRFTVMEDEFGTATKHPFIIDLSEDEHGVFLDLPHPENSNNNISINSEIAKEIKTVLDSPYDDTVIGNDLNNILGCSGGSDHLTGGRGRDTYVIDKTCKSVTVNNTDSAEDYDLMLLKCPNSNISLLNSSNDLVLRCTLENRTLDINFQSWFTSSHNQHLIVKTIDKISAFLPENTRQLQLTQGRLLPFQVESDEDCNGEHQEIDLTSPQFKKCERFVAKTDACSFSITGNSLNNYIDPGPDNPYGYQHLMGGNGTDTYVLGHRYGLLNVIDNYAEDEQVDHLLLDVLFHNIDVSLNGMNVLLQSLSSADSIQANITNYFAGSVHQHLLVHSADGVLFKLIQEFPYIETIMVDFSQSPFSQIIDIGNDSAIVTARLIIGSKTGENHIQGGENSTKLVGGLRNDTIYGGPGGEELIGLDGDDIIDGGPGNDKLYGGDGDDILNGGPGDDTFYAGMGADTINGSSGSDTVIFSGYNFTGVIVDLQVGLGWNADAEGDSYNIISNVIGSEYDDTLVGNDEDNVIKGQGGDDFIVPGGGDDLLQGGRGTDIYFLADAFGHKVINNFATDEVTDLIVLNKTLWENVCYHFLGMELQININFDVRNSSEAFSRLLAYEGFLMVTLPFWLHNDTYQHIVFSFLDSFKTEVDFEEHGHQLQSAVDLIQNGSFFRVEYLHQSNIALRFDYNLSYLVTFDQLSFKLVHVQPNNVTYLTLPFSSSHRVLRTGLKSGTVQHFSVSLSSCGLIVAMSPLVSTSTLPSLPADVTVAVRFFDGFILHWTSPDNETDPFVLDYQYIIKIRTVTGGRSFEFRTHDTVFSTYELNPSTGYNISICSEINTVSNCTLPLTTSTTSNYCSNLLNLPPHLMIAEFDTVQRVARLSCESGYRLTGNNRVTCNDTRLLLPHCTAITCTLPSVPHTSTTTTRLSGPIEFGASVTWRCHSDYWVHYRVTEFSSTCRTNNMWNPPIRRCIEKPTCPALTVRAPQHSSINSSAQVFHVDDAVSYQCNSGYSLQGPALKRCTYMSSRRTAYWYPLGGTVCNVNRCPNLLPQPNGRYSPARQNYYTMDTVNLSCNAGYYIQDDPVSPERVRLQCNGRDWNTTQMYCKLIISILSPAEYLDSVVAFIRYAVPSLRNTLVPQNALYYSLACRNLTGNVRYNILYTLSIYRRIQCYRRLSLINGPNVYEGVLSISTHSGNQIVCIEHSSAASTACRALGYSRYTSSLYRSAVPISTTLAYPSNRIVSTNKSCHHRISCRKSCEELYVANGANCFKSFQGQSCTVRCNAGYGLIGSSSLTCGSDGQWSGTLPRCDGEKWKADIERESRPSRSHQNLAIHLRDYLRNNYPGVDWVVIVYDEVVGFPKHTVAGSYYHLFRHYGHNIVVGRQIANSRPSPHANLENTFLQAYARREECSTSWFTTTCRLDARRTVDATWDRLVSHGVSPVMLHIVRDGANIAVYYYFSQSYIVVRKVSGGFATLIAN